MSVTTFISVTYLGGTGILIVQWLCMCLEYHRKSIQSTFVLQGSHSLWTLYALYIWLLYRFSTRHTVGVHCCDNIFCRENTVWSIIYTIHVLICSTIVIPNLNNRGF